MYDGEACDLCDLRSNELFLPILLMIDRLVGRLVLVVPAKVHARRICHPSRALGVGSRGPQAADVRACRVLPSPVFHLCV